VEVTIVDACTRRGRGGSPTAVVIDDGGTDDEACRAVVRGADTSHGAFVDAGSDAVRFFTTAGELTNCGHGTIAAQAVLLHRLGPDVRHGRQRTGGRTFDTTAVRRGDGIEVWFDQGLVEVRAGTPEGLGPVLDALGVAASAVAAADAPVVASPGTPRLLVPVATTAALLSLRPDPRRLAAACREYGYLGCFVYTTSPGRGTAAARMFAPAIAVDEDIVNANSTGCLAAYLLAAHGRGEIEVEQGDIAGRPSLVLASATAVPGGVSTRVGGTAVIQPCSGSSVM
jgi:PhzF family phenazine biosynthesis protein